MWGLGTEAVTLRGPSRRRSRGRQILRPVSWGQASTPLPTKATAATCRPRHRRRCLRHRHPEASEKREKEEEELQRALTRGLMERGPRKRRMEMGHLLLLLLLLLLLPMMAVLLRPLDTPGVRFTGLPKRRPRLRRPGCPHRYAP
ncbi:unnamed protein product, partial [Ectocarpus sp. 12 AP-2014]